LFHRIINAALSMLYNNSRRRLLLNETDRQGMRVAGKFNAQLFDAIRAFIKPGVTTGQIDHFVETYVRDHGHTAASKGYPGQSGPFPASCCTSVNDVICHGVPDNYALQDGDIVNVDVATVVNGWHGDSSETFIIGQPRDNARRVVQAAFDCLWLAIDNIKPNSRVSEIGDPIVRHAKKLGFSVVEEYVGHGLGRLYHQPPTIPHVPTPEARRTRLEPGMCFTIEPMINTGRKDSVQSKRDGWTVRTTDGGLSAQFEHSILMTESGPEVLTLTKTGPQRGHKF
jgi:methionyl aminopeptidase